MCQAETERDEEETIIRGKVRKRQETEIEGDVWCNLNKADRYEMKSESQIRQNKICKISSKEVQYNKHQGVDELFPFLFCTSYSELTTNNFLFDIS